MEEYRPANFTVSLTICNLNLPWPYISLLYYPDSLKRLNKWMVYAVINKNSFATSPVIQESKKGMSRKCGIHISLLSRLALWLLLSIVTEDHYKSINLFEKFLYQSILTDIILLLRISTLSEHWKIYRWSIRSPYQTLA